MQTKYMAFICKKPPDRVPENSRRTVVLLYLQGPVLPDYSVTLLFGPATTRLPMNI